MSAEISIGVLFVVMGLVFVLIPLEHLKKAFPLPHRRDLSGLSGYLR